MPPPSAHPLLSPVPAEPSGARECLTLVDLISNPLTFSSARQAWVPGNVKILFPLPPAPASPRSRPRTPSYPSVPLAFPHAALGEGRVLPQTLGSRHPPPRTPPRGQPRPLPRILHVAMQTRGCQALQTMPPCAPARAWALVWPAAPRLPAGGGACTQGGGGRCWPCGSRYCSPPPRHRPPRSSELESPEPRGSGCPGAACESPKASRA